MNVIYRGSACILAQLAVLTDMNLRISSRTITGALKYSTACHSVQFSGVIRNIACTRKSQKDITIQKMLRLTVKNGTYRIIKCNAMLSVIAPTRNGFFHTGNANKLSFSDNEFMALNISTVTKMERLMVVARCAMMLVNMSQPISGNNAEHWWKCVCDKLHT
jgi:hypothetical protein